MMTHPYRLPRKYRYPRSRYRKNISGKDLAIGVAIVAVAVSAANPKAVTGAVHRAGAGIPARTMAAPVPGGSENAFIRAVLADMGAPATPANISSLASWVTRESSSWPPAAANNPMNTTMDAAGATAFNGVGVKNYPAASEGAQATAVTLGNGGYPRIAAALRSGNGLCGNPALAGEFLTWSGNGYSGVC